MNYYIVFFDKLGNIVDISRHPDYRTMSDYVDIADNNVARFCPMAVSYKTYIDENKSL